MLFLRSWIEKYVSLDNISNEELSEKVTLGSSEVEEVVSLKDYFDAKVLVGRIENVRKHENADRLQVFDINLGDKGTRQIVSAAPNVRENLIVPVALEGARLAYLTIANRPMRGVESQGMCLGKSELMLETKPSSGLWELEEELHKSIPNRYSTIEDTFGQSICDVFPELFPEETIMDIKVLPNRMSEIGHHIGMAREIALLFGDKVSPKPELEEVMNEDAIKSTLEGLVKELPQSDVQFKLQDKVDYVNSFALLDIRLGSEYYLPHEYQKAMMLTERNLIGSIADLTNYFLADFGQPTHIFGSEKVFDEHHNVDWVVDRTITPRPFKGLGNLKDTILPIGIPILYDTKDPENLLALPAISGSDSSKSDLDGTRFLLEIANFDGDDVAQASFDLKYRSEGSRLWAGGVNKALIGYTIIKLLKESLHTEDFDISLCGLFTDENGSVITDRVEIAEILQGYATSQKQITIDWDYLSRRFDGRGSEVWKSVIKDFLSVVGRVDGDTFYPDVFFSNITTQNDLLEELIRLIDYDDLADHVIEGAGVQTWDTTYESLLKLKKRVTEYGFQEVITRPFVSQEHLKNTDESSVIRVLKPYNSLQPYVRDNLSSSLLLSISENIQRGEKSPLVFESGLVYLREGDIVHAPRHITLAGISDDPYIFTTVLKDILELIHDDHEAQWQETTTDKGKTWSYTIDGEEKASVTEVSNAQKKIFGIPLNKRLFVAHANLDQDFPDFAYRGYYDETQYPVVRRTYSYTLDSDIRLDHVVATINQIDTDMNVLIKPLERMNSGESKDVLNIDILYKSYERTLSGEEIEQFEQSMLNSLKSLGQVELR
jgi:phenylalanyl-tRNA synthetase beta chain